MKIRSLIYNMLTGVALFTLSACADSVSEFFGLEDRERISFTATTDEKIEELTRAAINEDSYVTAFQNTQPKKPLVLSSSVTRRDTETTRGQRIGSAEDLTAFRVSAAIASRNVSEDAFAALTPNYFYNLKAQKNSDDIFEISRDYYWPSSDDKLWFYAYAPCDDSNVLISDQTVGGPQKVSFTVATNVNNQVDLMTANAATTSFTSASGETTKTSVALNFRHELTAIRFIIGEQWLAGSIKSIGIYNVHGRGTMTIGADDATKWEWKNKAGNAVAATDDFVLTVDKGGLSGTDGEEFIEDTDLYFLMIPQSFDDNNDAYIEVKYQDNAREYTVSAPLKGQPAWVRNTTVTYAISSHELTKLKIGTISWPDATGDDAWNGPKIDFAAGDEVGLYVVDPDGLTIQPHHQNVRCSYDGGSWTVHHPEDHPVYKLPDYQYFFYYPYTPTPDTTYPVAGQNTTNTTATAFFSHLIDGWTPAAVQNTSLATLNAQDLQVAKGVDDAQQSSTVNATMAHQMNLAKLKLGGTSVTDTWIYPIDNGAYTWNYQPDNRDVMASDNFSVNFPYLYSDAHYYFVFAPVETNTDTGVLLKALNNLGTATDWSWELKSLERGKLLTHTATSADVGNNVMHSNELTVAQISPLTATGSALTIPVNVTVNSTALTKGTDYTVSYKNSSNTTVTSISAAGNYTAYISPKGRYSGDAVPRAFTVNKAGKGISFANTSVVKTYGDAAFTQTVTNTGTGTVTYSSGNTNVATVNSSSGQVTIKAAGTAVITATVADNEYYTYATKTATYTLTVNKAASTYTAPTAKNLTYSGSAQALVNAGSTSHGAMQYKLSTSSTWSTSIPTATNAGSYTVNYKVVGDANHNDNSGGSVAVTIGKAASSVTTAPTAKSGLAYNASAQALVNAGAGSGGTMQYKLNSGSWGTSIPTATNAGTYTVYYKVVGDANHNDNSGSSVAVTIGKRAATITASNQTVNYGTAITQGTGKITSSGLLSGHSISAITLTQSTTNCPGGTITPSAATIKDGSNNNVTSNYNITYNKGTLTINKVAATLSLNNTNAVSFTSSNGVNATNTAHTASYSGGTLTASSSNTSYATASISGSTITVTRKSVLAFSGVTITVSVTPDGNHTAPASKSFTVSGAYSGNGIALSSATSSHVGRLICSKSHIHTNKSSIDCGGSAVAIVVYVGAAGTADASSSTYKGLAMALTSIDGKQWGTGASCHHVYQNSTFSTVYNYGDMSGISNTNVLASYTSGHTHPAAVAAKNYSSTVAVPSGCSQWFMPTIGQWCRFLRGVGLSYSSEGYTTGYDIVRNMLLNAGVSEIGSRYIWTSTEYNNEYAWGVHSYTSPQFGIFGNPKQSGYSVRPFLAF